jgi:hypothetical protein
MGRTQAVCIGHITKPASGEPRNRADSLTWIRADHNQEVLGLHFRAVGPADIDPANQS